MKWVHRAGIGRGSKLGGGARCGQELATTVAWASHTPPLSFSTTDAALLASRRPPPPRRSVFPLRTGRIPSGLYSVRFLVPLDRLLHVTYLLRVASPALPSSSRGRPDLPPLALPVRQAGGRARRRKAPSPPPARRVARRGGAKRAVARAEPGRAQAVRPAGRRGSAWRLLHRRGGRPGVEGCGVERGRRTVGQGPQRAVGRRWRGG